MTKKTKTTNKKSKSKTAPAAAAAVAAPKVEAAKGQAKPAATTESIQARAHQIWIAKGKPVPGTPIADWLQAERELGVRKT